jgi:hypothetical protein
MNPDPNQPIQFDKAEFTGPTLTCAACKAPITSEYYQANGRTICPVCRDQVAKFGVGGSGAARFGKSLVAGIAAGFVGFLLYYLVLKITGWNIGLIAVVVGWLVGNAVRWGSEGRGGRLYQFLAAAIAYIAACATYAPFIMEGHSGVVAWIVAVIVSMAVPWLEGPSNLIGWLILGFAVYEAWRINRSVRLDITGPFFTRQAPPPAAT